MDPRYPFGMIFGLERSYLLNTHAFSLLQSTQASQSNKSCYQRILTPSLIYLYPSLPMMNYWICTSTFSQWLLILIWKMSGPSFEVTKSIPLDDITRWSFRIITHPQFSREFGSRNSPQGLNSSPNSCLWIDLIQETCWSEDISMYSLTHTVFSAHPTPRKN